MEKVKKSKTLKRKFQVDFQYVERDDVEPSGNIWGCDIMAHSRKQALFLFARKHVRKKYKILQVTDWGVPEYLKEKQK